MNFWETDKTTNVKFFPPYGMGREDPDDSQFRSTMKRKLMLYKKRKQGYRKWRAGR